MDVQEVASHDTLETVQPEVAAANSVDEALSTEKADANDYSRFDNLDDTDVDSSDDEPATMPLTERLSRATTCKNSGNECFQRQSFDEAKTNYREAIKLLEPVKDNECIQKEELRKVLRDSHCNLAMVFIKQEDWAAAIKSCKEAIKLDARNVKALYRRSVARSNFGLLDEAIEDLQLVLELDPENKAAKKELVVVTRKLAEEKQRQKNAFSGLFERGGLMYEDREREREVKAKVEQERRAKEEDEWRQENIKRRDMGDVEETFEEWKKKRTADANASPAPASTSSKKPRKRDTPSGSSGNSDKKEEEEYDEEDMKIISETRQKGYNVC
jgi:tetratricopeptide (TPR) repeat protein